MQIIWPKGEKWELSTNELKELLDWHIAPHPAKKDSSNISQSQTEQKVTLAKPKLKKAVIINNHNQKVTLEQIKQIKDLAENGMDNKKIAERLGIKISLIPYWRKNTPKELIINE